MLNIVPQTDPVLRQPAQPVTVFNSKIRQIAKEMLALMKENRGVGLAAPQVGISQQIIVINTDKNINALALINPQILARSTSTEEDTEGCLSLPGVSLKINRARKISVAFQDEFGHPREIKAKRLTARVLQHEIDHLNGILITDYTKTEK